MRYKVLAVALWMTAPVAGADEITRVDLGRQVVRVSQPVNTVFARQTVTLPAVCPQACGDKVVRWEALASPLKGGTSRPGTYLFASGIKGIAIQVEAPDSARGLAEQALTLQVGLVRVTPEVAAGVMALSTPLLRWRLETEEGRVEKSGRLQVGATLTTGSCEPETGTLRFTPGAVRLADLSRTAPGRPVSGSGDSQSIEVSCTPGALTALSVSFLARSVAGNPTLLQTDNEGVSFMMVDGVYHQAVHWDKSHPLIYPVPASGQVRIPLTVYYAPTGEAVRAGRVTAQARFTVDYR